MAWMRTRRSPFSSSILILSMERNTAASLAPLVRVNCVCPSFVRSGMSIGELMLHAGIDDPVQADAAWTRVGEKTGPLGRSVEPTDIGQAVVWLCESDMVVGIALPVTGGSGLPGLG